MSKIRIQNQEPALGAGYTILTGTGGVQEYKQLTGNNQYLGTDSSGVPGVFPLPSALTGDLPYMAVSTGQTVTVGPNSSQTFTPTGYSTSHSNNSAGVFSTSGTGITISTAGTYQIVLRSYFEASSVMNAASNFTVSCALQINGVGISNLGLLDGSSLDINGVIGTTSSGLVIGVNKPQVLILKLPSGSFTLPALLNVSPQVVTGPGNSVEYLSTGIQVTKLN